MKCRRCFRGLELGWSFCPHCSLPVETAGGGADSIQIAAWAGLPPPDPNAPTWQEQLRLIREIVQIAVRHGLRDFFGGEAVPGSSVWVMRIAKGEPVEQIGPALALAQRPLVSFQRPEQLEDVQTLLRTALEIAERQSAPGDPLHLACVRALTEILRTGEKMREALEVARKALGWAEMHSPESHPSRAWYLAHLAWLLRQAGRSGLAPRAGDPGWEEERELLEEVLRIVGLEAQADWALAFQALQQLAEHFQQRDDSARAEVLLKRLLKSAEAILGEGHLQTAGIRYQLGVIYRTTCRLKLGEVMLRAALKSLGEHARNSGQEPDLLIRAHQHYAHLLVDWGIEETAANASANNVRDGRELGIRLPDADAEKIKPKPGEVAFSANCPAHPRSLPKGQPFQVEIGIHSALDLLRAGDSSEGGKDLSQGDEVGVKVTLLFKPAHVVFSHGELPKRVFLVDWRRAKKMVRLDLLCPNTLADPACRESLDIFVEGIRIGVLEMDLHFAELGTAPVSVRCQFAPALSAYACFAPEDRYEAMGRVEQVRRAVPHLRIVLGAEALRSREDSRTQLKDAISQTERFWLFWSSHARQSDDVRWEWLRALETKGIGCIDPVRIEGNAMPPKEIRPAFERALMEKGRAARTPRGQETGKTPPAFSAFWPREYTRGLPKGEAFSLELALEESAGASADLGDQSTPPALARGVEVALVFQPSRLAFRDGRVQQVSRMSWNGRRQSYVFDVYCPREVAAQTCRESMRVFVEGVPVGSILLDLHFSGVEEDHKLVECRFEPFRSAFACFAEADRYDMEGRLQGVGRIVPEFEVRPCPPDAPETLAGKQIEEAERFLLFWSNHARKNHAVEAQWKHALDRRQVGAIDVVRVEIDAAPARGLEAAFDRALPFPEEVYLNTSVNCAAHPDKLPAGEVFTLDVSLSLPERFVEAPGAEPSPAQLHLVFEPEHVQLASQRVVEIASWSGGAAPCMSCEMFCPTGLPAKATLRESIRVFVEDVPAGCIQLDLRWDDRGRYALAVTSRFQAVPSTYWCFAPEDAYEVMDRLERVRRFLPGLGLEEARRTMQLRSGPSKLWEEAIEERERFLLFWSTSAERSEPVKAEVAHAIRKKGIGAVDMVVLGPQVKRPPAELEGPFSHSFFRCERARDKRIKHAVAPPGEGAARKADEKARAGEWFKFRWPLGS